MKFSLKWLGDFIETSSFFEEPQKLADQLTQAGIEVDSFEDQSTRFNKIITAQILSVKKHPQADRLTVCEVKTDQETLSIVCGAKNHKEGDKVVLVQVGAILPQGLKIKKSRIRGVTSEGMLASKSELELHPIENSVKTAEASQPNNTEEGIWILPPSAPLGQNLATYLNCDDILFEVTAPPNRADSLSHKGLAREISSLFSIPLQDSSLKRFDVFKETFKDNQTTNNQNIKEHHNIEHHNIEQNYKNLNKELNSKQYFSIEVQDKKACPRYCACFIEGLRVQESPKWLQQRLNSLGLKSINNVVDVTNFILWDQGQPLHAFDRDKIQNIEIAPAKEGEKFLSLDENEISLSLEDLTIRDKKSVLALAGIMGGLNSSISEKTQNIVIEAACFTPEKIRKSSKRIGLETDSSYRFARGVNPHSVFSAMETAAVLIQKLAGGKISKYFYDLNSTPKQRHSISISLDDISARLGCSIKASSFEKQMQKAFCELTPAHEKKAYIVSPPSHRSDLKIKEDLIEEFARLEGYNKIPENPPTVFFNEVKPDKTFLKFQKWIQHFSSRSWLQSIHYSFCDPDYYKDFLNSQFYLEELLEDSNNSAKNNSANNFAKNSKKHPNESKLQEKTSFKVNNPISQKFSLMKPLLTPDLFKSIVQNFRKNNKQGQLFELSPIFYRKERNYQQDWHLALGLWGEPLDIWQSQTIPNFYKMKTELEAFFQATSLKISPWEEASLPFLHPKKTLVLNYQKRKIGFMGVLHPTLAEKHKIPVEVVLAEIDLSSLEKKPDKASIFKPFSNLLTVEKDLCFVIPENTPVQKVKKEIEKTLSSICQEVLIFDIYKKENKRFVSFRMRLSPQDKSWTDEELQSFLEKVIQSLNQKFSIQLKP